MANLSLLVLFFLVSYMTGKNFVEGIGIQLQGNLSKTSNAQKCTKDCIVVLNFGEHLTWPEECAELTEKVYCTVDIIIDYTLKMVGINFQPVDFLNDTTWSTSGISEYLLQTSFYRMGKQGFQGPHLWVYMCSTDVDECDKKYAETNLDQLIKSINQEATYNKLSSHLFSDPTQVKQCYISSSDLTDCRDGICIYGDNPQGVHLRDFPPPEPKPYCVADESDPVQAGHVFGHAISGSSQYNFDYIAFSCTIDKCNGPTTIDAVKSIFKDEGEGSQAYAVTADFLKVFFIAILPVFFSTVF